MGDRFSNLDEQSVIDEYLKKIKYDNGTCVDIAASDGISMSNTYSLFLRGWDGLAVECDSWKFARLTSNYSKFKNVKLEKTIVTPDSVVHLLETAGIKKDFEFLNLDIDGYEFFVLSSMLERFRPRLVCVEINEKIPPPIKFTVKWSPSYSWAGDHFFGLSISKLHELCCSFGYSIVNLHYNNAFLMPLETSSEPQLTPEEAYSTGYLMRPDRKAKFPWNSNMECVLGMQAQEAMTFLREYFKKYEGLYEMGV